MHSGTSRYSGPERQTHTCNPIYTRLNELLTLTGWKQFCVASLLPIVQLVSLKDGAILEGSVAARSDIYQEQELSQS